jgi:hypothetical protein
MVYVFEEPAKRQRRQLRLPVRLHHLPHRDARAPETFDDVVGTASQTPRGQPLVDQVVLRSAPVDTSGPSRNPTW